MVYRVISTILEGIVKYSINSDVCKYSGLLHICRITAYLQDYCIFAGYLHICRIAAYLQIMISISVESLIHTQNERASEKVRKLGKETEPNTSLLQNNLVRQQSYNRVIRLHLDHPRVW